MSTTEIVPGWYADPTVPGHIRYWDVNGWTEHSAAPLPGAVPTSRGPLGLPVVPRTPRRRPPMPAFFVAGTALVGIPLAIMIGVLAAHASSPPPLDIPVPVDAREAADDAAKHDVSAIGVAIEQYYKQTDWYDSAPPVVVFAEGTFTLEPVLPYRSTSTGVSYYSTDWEWTPTEASEGVTFGGQTGYSTDTWCVWVTAEGGVVKTWQVTVNGVVEGTCGLGQGGSN